MRVETIELLRCVAVHESSPLVTVADSRDGDRLIEGTLGCAVCGAEYALTGGVAFLATGRDTEPSRAAVDATRTAALLGVSEPGARVVLCGAYAGAADEIEQVTGALCITVNATGAVRAESAADHLVIDASARLPMASASLGAMAVDLAHVALLADAARVVRTGGRVLAPASAPVPHGLRELARDDDEWVAVVETSASAPVSLRRGSATSP